MDTWRLLFMLFAGMFLGLVIGFYIRRGANRAFFNSLLRELDEKRIILENLFQQLEDRNSIIQAQDKIISTQREMLDERNEYIEQVGEIFHILLDSTKEGGEKIGIGKE